VKERAYSKVFDGGRSVPPGKKATPHNLAMQHRRIAATAALLADPSRAAIVLALMDGRARSAKKLALDAGVTPQTASTHLKKLVAAELLVWQGNGREKHFSLASAEVAQAVESLSSITVSSGPRELRFARCCYDHLAGQLGVAITDRLLMPGNTVLANLKIVVENSRRPPFRCCTDWTERRPHVAGALGAALLRHYLEQRWLVRVEDSRKLVITPRGKEAFVRLLGVEEALFPA
jgi:DNA-binding transcriptional ArsR family regulator